MQVETLELRLREEGLLSEEEIRQVLSFIFSLDSHLKDPFVCEMRNYFKKFLVFSAVNAYKAIVEKDPPQEFSHMVSSAIDDLAAKLSERKFPKEEFMDEAERVIVSLIADRKKKIVGVSSLAFEETISGLFPTERADELKASFAKNLMLQLNNEE